MLPLLATATSSNEDNETALSEAVAALAANAQEAACYTLEWKSYSSEPTR